MRYDTIIVGGGSSGGVLAARLSESPEHRIVLLEAGPDYPSLEQTPEPIRNGLSHASDQTIAREHNWGWTARVNNEAPLIAVPRGKVMGGSSSINAVIFLRGEPDDYDAWAAAGNELWSFERVLPAFCRMEADRDFGHDDCHGAQGPIGCYRFPRESWLPTAEAFYSAALELGFPDCPDHNRFGSTGVGPVPVNIKDGVRLSTALTYLLNARERKNLTIRGRSLVRRILFERHGEQLRAVGVEVEDLTNGEVFELEANEVIVSGGAVGSPQLLMVSGVGPREALRACGVQTLCDRPGVGQSLRGHPTVWLEYRMAKPFAPQSFEIPDQVCLRWTAEGSDLTNDMVLFSTPFDIGIGSGRSAGSTGELGLRWRARVNLAYSRGELRLESSDIHDPPQIDFNFLADPRDVERLRQAVRLGIRLAEQPAFSGLLSERLEPRAADLESDAALDAWMCRRVQTGHHICGTCKMGPSTDPMAVVDQVGRVHGIRGLRVVDASIMPDCIRANTNQTALMIGERIAELMSEDA